MGILDSIILTVYTLAMMVLSLLMVLGAIAPKWIQPAEWLTNAMDNTRGQVTVGIIGFMFFISSVRLITLAFRRQGGGQPVVHETSLGEVRISLEAVENLVRKVARSTKGVREMKAVVRHGKDGLCVSLRGTVSPDVAIPEVSEEIQNNVRQYVKRVVGVELAEIQLEVENIASDSRRTRLD
ncbi:MAG TPA: alkaline shock response membrane anchor protein AmaP [Symbiobacteriaceae bacterium]